MYSGSIKYLLMLPFFWLHASICYFQPPEKWECVKPADETGYVQIGFLGSGKTLFRPSLNLSIEQVDLGLKEYVKAVREIHEKEMHLPWRDLGEFVFKAGKGRLGEITSHSALGEIKMLQAIFIKNGFAYILTGSAHRDDFAETRPLLLKALRSLTLAADLFAPISDTVERERIKKRYEQFVSLSPDARDEEWKELQAILAKQSSILGSHWLYLALQEGYKCIFTPESSKAGQKPPSE